MGGGGVGEAQCFIKMGENKERKYVGLKIKRSERRAHGVYLNLYKSKYSTINRPIQFSHLNFKNFHPHVQNNVRNGVQHKQKTKNKKQKNKKTKKRGGGWGRNITVFLYSLYL